MSGQEGIGVSESISVEVCRNCGSTVTENATILLPPEISWAIVGSLIVVAVGIYVKLKREKFITDKKIYSTGDNIARVDKIRKVSRDRVHSRFDRLRFE